ncbi:SH2 domain-containing protein A-like isoform X2 [Phragmites australis]|uniref:SH2 domain-containing protein A-like isoform X2 n=1 Tax=Phragmites australis TaxID=29695 RepID=UPI002D779C4E|nr:SH2 domain-containing protein A-like isoform X2 [Phragmites australis]
MAAPECGGSDGYRDLRGVRVDLNPGTARGGFGGGFAVCFWLYLSSSARPSSVILHQMTAGDDNKLPFLALGEGNKLLLFPLLRLHREAPAPDSSYPWTDTTNLSAISECPLEKWFHIGCEVTENVMRLHIDGDLIAEAHLCSLSDEPDSQDDANQISLVGRDGKLEGYVYNIEVSSVLGTVQEQCAKSPPFKLSIDYSCSDGVEEGDDGVWSIVGGKASCRRNFILEVILINAFGEPVKDKEVVASLVYADNGAVVEKSRDDSEPPLLVTCEGLEYPAISRPLPIIRGRALFKLKISQLSSKCDKKLFRIHFSTLHMRRYPFLEAYSKPIHCISRNRTSRLLGSVACFHPSKFPKTEGDGMAKAVETHKMISQNKHTRKMVVGKEAHNVMWTDSSTSDYDSFDAESSWSGSDGDEVETVSDAVIFRYCLDSTYERSKFLRGAARTVNKDDLVKVADQVSLYSGCSHHRNQILMSKRLLREGANTWSMISKNNERALWSSAIPEVITKFMDISHSTFRGLSERDLEVLRGIAGCGDDIGRDEFDRLWYWLYPVASSLSRDKIKQLWECTAPRWIEGLITIEEAENALRSSAELLKEPGTFVLRFPTTRSWPHPDAGSLVVTYVGFDNLIHHRLLSLDSSDARAGNLQDLLLQEPELSQLGRVDRLPTAMRT